MSTPDSPKRARIRRDGWTAERQLRFLQMLAKTRNVSRAAACVRMSRESAYRLRSRLRGELFALAWDSVYLPRFAASGSEIDKGHIDALRMGLRPEGAPPRRAGAPMSKA